MADAYVDKVANELADMALADEKASKSIKIVDEISEILGASSQTLQETYMTAIRVRRAEARARKILGDRLDNNYEEAAKPAAAPLQGVKKEPEPEAEPKVAAQEEPEPAPEAAPAPVAGMPRRVTR